MSGAAGTETALLVRRFGAFALEQFPFAASLAQGVLRAVAADEPADAQAIERLRGRFAAELRRRISTIDGAVDVEDPTPGVRPADRMRRAADDLVAACDGFLRRAALRASLTAAERREILEGMVLTRATDNRLKTLFTNGEVRYGDAAFQGKGFRSLGQEAIYGAGIRLRRGDAFREGNEWRGDVIAPLIRDLGLIFAMHRSPEMVQMVLSAQMGK